MELKYIICLDENNNLWKYLFKLDDQKIKLYWETSRG